MRLFLSVMTAAFVLTASSEQCQAGLAPSITVSNVAPSGNVTGNQNNTVTADVKVVGLQNGTYDVTIVVYDYGPPQTSKQTTGTVVIANGKGTVSISAAFPKPVASGDTGIVQVEVSDPNSGTSDTDDSNITYK